MNRSRWTRHRPLFASPVPPEVRKPKIRWRPLRIIGLAIRKTCTVIGAFVLITLIMAYLSVSSIKTPAAPPLPQKLVLYIEFGESFDEIPSGSSFANTLGLTPPTVHELTQAIDAAAKDPRVQGIMARMDSGTYATVQSDEVRDAIKRFRSISPDRFTAIYSPSYGEAGGGLGRFYLASAFAERWMQPLGVVAIPGISAEMPFFRDTLDKIGVLPEFFKRKEYKTAYENITDSQMSDYNREEVTRLIGDLGGELTQEIAADLGISEAKFQALVNKGLFTASEALHERLITDSSYVDILISRITEKITGNPESEEEIFVDPRTYLAGLQREEKERNLVRGQFGDTRPDVAVVYITGMILDSRFGAETAPGMGGGGIAAADEIAPALLEAAEDPNISAVVVRIDSPGGSPVASETILRAIDKVREKKKPVIVSMGSTAASGGYWVAAHADRIFAAPTTITGSIGVVGGKFSIGGLSEKIGVNWDGVQWGENAGLWTVTRPFNESEAERMNAMLDQVYNAFLQRVAEGRKMSVAQVDAIAGGRVWSGVSALKVGLVDELGGYQDALDYTAKLVGRQDRFDLDTVILPKPLTPFEELMILLGEEGAVIEGLKLQAAIAKRAGPIMNQWAVMENMSRYSTYEPLRIR